MEIYSCIVILGVVVLLSAEKTLHISRRHKRQVDFDGQAIGGAVNSFLHGFLGQYQYNERPFGTLHQFEGQGSDHNHRWNHNQGNGGCNSDNGGCQHGCRFARGRKRCYCNSGYFLLEDRQMCSDIDECSSQYNRPCQDVCTNTEGSYKCGCSNGLTLLPDGSCISSAVGESCSENNGGCHQLCRDRRRRGGVRCKCSDGYKLGSSDRRSCFDIDECSSGFHDCGQLMCVNTNGSYQCKSNSYVLVTADPCKDSNGGCQHSCVNANGTVQCHCEAGFQLVNGKLCQHVMLLPTDQPFLTSTDPSSTTSTVPPQTYLPSTVTFSISEASTTISPRKNECGINTKKSLFRRIVGGKPADPKDWPWMAALLRSPESQQFCGGTLITDKHVLTAAHCVQTFAANDIRVRLGEYKFSSPDDSNPTEFKVEVIRKHEGYNTQTQENDIAILKLDRSAVFSDSIWPACLPPSNNNFEDQPGYVIGWGTIFFGGPVSSVLQEVVIPVWKQGDCVAAYPDNKVSDTMMCCGQKSGGKDSCQGDSGGPFLVQIFPNSRWHVAGIVSWGKECASVNHPGVYTRVNQYLEWIKNNDVQ